MVLASPNPIRSTERVLLPSDLIPIVDLKAERSEVKKLIVRACEEYGFFKVVNHGISDETIAKMEEAGFGFFAKPMAQKKLAAPAYGCKNIGFNGDIGEVEYLLLNAPTSSSIAQISKTISNIDPSNFRYVTNVHSLLCFFFLQYMSLSHSIFHIYYNLFHWEKIIFISFITMFWSKKWYPLHGLDLNSRLLVKLRKTRVISHMPPVGQILKYTRLAISKVTVGVGGSDEVMHIYNWNIYFCYGPC